MLNYILLLLQQHYLVEEESGCWTDKLKTFGSSWKKKYNKDPEEQQEFYIIKEWDHICLHQLFWLIVYW